MTSALFFKIKKPLIKKTELLYCCHGNRLHFKKFPIKGCPRKSKGKFKMLLLWRDIVFSSSEKLIIKATNNSITFHGKQDILFPFKFSKTTFNGEFYDI